MAQHRKDLRGRALRDGEFQRKDNQLYVYSYVDCINRRRYIYAPDIATLRKKEDEIKKNQLAGIDAYSNGKSTINDMFERYMAFKKGMRKSTKENYLYLYDKYVKDTFGKRRINEIVFSDVLNFYSYLLCEKDIGVGTVQLINCFLHPTFDLAVRDNILRYNPSNSACSEAVKASGKTRKIRHALTKEEQQAFMNYVSTNPIFCKWWPLFTILLGTGMRIGECLGLTWNDLDFDKRTISVNHAVVYSAHHRADREILWISKPKTDAGIRIIPMFDIVRDAFLLLREQQDMHPTPEFILDGYSDFIFFNRRGNLMTRLDVNLVINRITKYYNEEEKLKAEEEGREALIIPHFTCHYFRHTFATRLCEMENNLKVIQSVMGHKKIETTMNIYAECTEQKKMESFDNLSAKMNMLF
jgi:integrase